jgi:phytol kinase
MNFGHGAGIVMSLALLPAALAGASMVARRGVWPAELARKLVHLTLGSVALSFPWTIGAAAGVMGVTLLAAVSFLSIRRSETLAALFGAGIQGVGRTSAGELYFTAAVALTYVAAGGEPLHYCLPLAILVFADSTAALVGTRPRARRHPLGGCGKTWAGSAAFFATAFLIALAAFTAERVTVPLPPLALAILMAFDATLLELCGRRGTDNILIPVGVLALLAGLEQDLAGTLLLHGVAVLACVLGYVRRQRVAAQP